MQNEERIRFDQVKTLEQNIRKREGVKENDMGIMVYSNPTLKVSKLMQAAATASASTAAQPSAAIGI